LANEAVGPNSSKSAVLSSECVRANFGIVVHCTHNVADTKTRFISNRRKVEKIILEGLRRAAPSRSAMQTPNHVQAQQEQENELRLRPRRISNESSGQENSDWEAPTGPAPRRQSSMLEELGRQASVFWHDEEGTEEDGTSTTDDEDEMLVEQDGETKLE